MPEPAVPGWDEPPKVPPWAEGEPPDSKLYVESELAVAGGLSTMAPFDDYSPVWALPHARRALDALSQWEPEDS